MTWSASVVLPELSGAEDLDDAAARQAADAERDVEPERAGRDRLDLHRFARAELHRRALAEGAVDLRERRLEAFCLSMLATSLGVPISFNCADMRAAPS
jgi:hypothetical protein